MPIPVHAWLPRHPWFSLLLLTLSFIVFGALSLDLARLFTANGALIWAHGWQGLVDGGAQQLFELLLKSLLAMLAYLCFKCCEQLLLQRLLRRG